MDMTDIRQVQDIQLETLKDIASFCSERGIRYALYCGTLLGAVRHQGFIPWDDDADLTMPLSDYRRFLAEFPPEFSDKYIVETYKTGRNVIYLWCKVFRKNTTYCTGEYLNYDAEHGIALDIYPMIGMADDPKAARIQKRMISAARTMLAGEYMQFIHAKHERHRFLHALIDHLPRSLRIRIASFIEKRWWIDPELTEYTGSLDAMKFEGKFRRTWWDEMTTGTFCGGSFTIPVQYDAVLRMMYGDYMQLPPEEKRIPHFPADTVLSLTQGPEEMKKVLSAKE